MAEVEAARSRMIVALLCGDAESMPTQTNTSRNSRATDVASRRLDNPMQC